MPNTYGAPEVSVKDVAAKIAAQEPFIFLDVREPNELTAAAIKDERVVNVPLSELALKQTAILPPRRAQRTSYCLVARAGLDECDQHGGWHR